MVLGLTTELIRALNEGKTLTVKGLTYHGLRLEGNKLVYVSRHGSRYECTQELTALRVEEFEWGVFEPKAPKTEDHSDLEKYSRLARLEERLHKIEEALSRHLIR